MALTLGIGLGVAYVSLLVTASWLSGGEPLGVAQHRLLRSAQVYEAASIVALTEVGVHLSQRDWVSLLWVGSAAGAWYCRRMVLSRRATTIEHLRRMEDPYYTRAWKDLS